MDSTAETLFILSILALFTVAVALHYLGDELEKVPLEEPEVPHYEVPECIEGHSEPCIKGSCNGIKECVDGSWTPCTLNVVCEPGKLYGCTSYGCSSGYRACNACGTGFGPCVGPGSGNLS